MPHRAHTGKVIYIYIYIYLFIYFIRTCLCVCLLVCDWLFVYVECGEIDRLRACVFSNRRVEECVWKAIGKDEKGIRGFGLLMFYWTREVSFTPTQFIYFPTFFGIWALLRRPLGKMLQHTHPWECSHCIPPFSHLWSVPLHTVLYPFYLRFLSLRPHICASVTFTFSPHPSVFFLLFTRLSRVLKVREFIFVRAARY
ncbi:hypothetical protein TbgDal_XI4190 [Trypanosoma brucei gambiense DAL972]|uniref:Uncharacterized protein n=1 Tax=Trypanosoma brucei gambiense (strain MHOM/CI/86/DAL972) TaxID=679716 RepID=D0A6K0_TRYB9|nr:hypothetical protein TbgDal_XI4190 [Trypanosoma brucei gambiense DAL972]CBH17301.1 hypothetical protein TbgDal_XI4190 [Trypanosoma brucei gambiense DAL972]|eukprot:XP_011779565.1 hypothetical protein TbgDal_XI4190 [Trypanosoma brucei gambiense DAL972]